MSYFPKKAFQGEVYDFDHLAPFQMAVVLTPVVNININVSFSTHCFTEAFDEQQHQDYHRYAFKGELRAFNLIRFDCSKNLPSLVKAIAKSKVYRASNNNYTFVAHIQGNGAMQPYSIFFELKSEKNKRGSTELRLYVESAYLSALKAPKHTKSWRFVSLAGERAGIFKHAEKKSKPKKKKTP